MNIEVRTVEKYDYDPEFSRPYRCWITVSIPASYSESQKAWLIEEGFRHEDEAFMGQLLEATWGCHDCPTGFRSTTEVASSSISFDGLKAQVSKRVSSLMKQLAQLAQLKKEVLIPERVERTHSI
jgi:hypothetical protein